MLFIELISGILTLTHPPLTHDPQPEPNIPFQTRIKRSNKDFCYTRGFFYDRPVRNDLIDAEFYCGSLELLSTVAGIV